MLSLSISLIMVHILSRLIQHFLEKTGMPKKQRKQGAYGRITTTQYTWPVLPWTVLEDKCVGEDSEGGYP